MKKIWKVVLIITAAVLVVSGALMPTLIIPMIASTKLRYPTHLRTYTNPANQSMTYENVSITTSDDVELKGWWVEPKDLMDPNSNITLVIMHGYSKNMAWMLDHYGDGFYDAGYRMLFFDARCRGESPDTEPGVTYGWEEKKDLKAAVDFVKAQPEVNDSQVVIFAESAGAACALFYTAEYNDIAITIADSSWADGAEMIERGFPLRSGLPWPVIGQISIKLVERKYGFAFADISPISYVSAITTPTFFIHGQADLDIPSSDSHDLFDAMTISEKRYWSTNDRGHVESYLEPNYFTEIEDFITTYL